MVLSERSRHMRWILSGVGIAAVGWFFGGAFGKGLAGSAGVMAAWCGLRWLWAALRDGPEQEALAASASLARRHFWGGTGIALDPARREVHLLQGRVYRRYPYAQLRGWESRQQTGGLVYGGGLAGLSATLAQGHANVKGSGLFIEVRDVEQPRWRIAFPPGRLAAELPRWMEILQQEVNESAPQRPGG